jgi:hypothetical protein
MQTYVTRLEALERLSRLRTLGRAVDAAQRAERYRRVALGEVVLPEATYPDECGTWPVSVPVRAMCRRVLEWNDGCAHDVAN